MPPARFPKAPSDEQKRLLERWVAEGAEYRLHWAYTGITRPAPPDSARNNWARNALDRFILAKLDREKVDPSPEADRRTLIRRLTLDLLGLPPTPEEVEAFVRDPSPDAYEKVVDRLLASPRYGERQAMAWLDLARYGDTNGEHLDDAREMWPWRDWVIQAFNTNKSFADFTIEQLAGDLLPGADEQARIATGFHRNPIVQREPTDAEVAHFTVADRVNTTGTVWLGSSLACAECHDHKYDPFTLEDYYRVYAVFNNVSPLKRERQDPRGNQRPVLQLPTPGQKEKLDALRDREEQLKGLLAREVQQADPQELELAGDFPTVQEWINGPVAAGAEVVSPGEDWTLYRHPLDAARRPATDQVVSPDTVQFGDRLFVHAEAVSGAPVKALVVVLEDSEGRKVAARWGDGGVPLDLGKEARVTSLGPLPEGSRVARLEVQTSKLNLRPGRRVKAVSVGRTGGEVVSVRVGLRRSGTAVSYSAWRREAVAEKLAPLPFEIKTIMMRPESKRSGEEEARLRAYYREHVAAGLRAAVLPLQDELDRLRECRQAFDKEVVSTMVMKEPASPIATHVLHRGSLTQKGKRVTPSVPAFLPAIPESTRVDRLSFARWLVGRDNPLTARVTANRLWSQHFGRGLVKTSEEFGSRGELPTHPELLDWLAAEFRDGGWDLKAIHRLIVTSQTYRQSSRATPDRHAADPENRWYARGPRFRLPAETIRDNALAVSGLLDQRIGGPSVTLYQPPGLWEAIRHSVVATAMDYEQSHGQDLYRRGMYTFWKRSLPHPSLTAFDAPTRECCLDRRPRTNTALQALVLLNDPIYVECARRLGERVMLEGGGELEQRLSYAMTLCVCRPPTAAELRVLRSAFEPLMNRYREDPAAANQLLGVGESPVAPRLDRAELAAWSSLANALLNLDETITLE
jgi:hypothetical protein